MIVTEWEQDCIKWRKRVLTGVFRHYCNDWDCLPIDETTPEFPCVCFQSWKTRLRWRIVAAIKAIGKLRALAEEEG